MDPRLDARWVNGRLRRGEVPTEAELRWFARGLASGAVTDAQAGAFAMGVCLRGLGEQGRVALTLGMRDSGRVLDWRLDKPVLDKHSTGGVGDAVSLILAPALAACGVAVPMISGRGLGHTGGTLDKMEAIPGVEPKVSEDLLRLIVAEVGCAIAGATAEIAPADRRLYAIRDVSGTVESIDLITASILSKKLAAGLEGLVLDVKVGSGAFMKTEAEARALAESLVATANGAGCSTAALVTDMDEPLCPALGNAVEVAVCLEVMDGRREMAPRLHDLTVALGGRLLALAGEEEGEGEERIAHAIASGAAMERFERMVAMMGGPADLSATWRERLPRAPVVLEVTSEQDGFVNAFDGEALGLVVVGLGGGRTKETDPVDPAVGLTDVPRRGQRVRCGDLLARVHARDEGAARSAMGAVLAAIRIGEAPDLGPLVRERVG
ncbi:Thymidine phosphorylase [Rubellimicrobium mesophilum DSM 19309]|uniref:Thymidine phosphorylase n=1 Tax=Rubellimicrobium mesophilum DSM 19309 TaxID=442562 RepID=A0A017HM81_9RHOB|nr:thymidine phosphorylase [Rubellimicrobium mesophilum]EYD75461.1 Thymidine phosphorylase [Rubellimicrobium mesophilum DSM 19309]